MTLPVERLRSIKWGLELIQELQGDQTIPDPFRIRAAGILGDYPSPEVLHALIDTGAAVLPAPYGQAIEDARELFYEIGRTGSSATVLRHRLEYCMRHYPLPGEAARLARPSELSIADWISTG